MFNFPIVLFAGSSFLVVGCLLMAVGYCSWLCLLSSVFVIVGCFSVGCETLVVGCCLVVVIVCFCCCCGCDCCCCCRLLVVHRALFVILV